MWLAHYITRPSNSSSGCSEVGLKRVYVVTRPQGIMGLGFAATLGLSGHATLEGSQALLQSKVLR